jgi:two-component sensor histidine kinase
MLGLGLHELATNAAKYGSFSVPEGRLKVHWQVRDEAFDLVWREYVPRLRRRAQRRGFGTEVIERMMVGALDAEPTRILHRDGIEWRFAIPLDRIRSASQIADDGGQAA